MIISRILHFFVAAAATLVLIVQVATAAEMPPQNERRVALVIGNGNYERLPKILNPTKDAEAIAASLRDVGFQSVKLVTDASRDVMTKSLGEFAEQSKGADWAVVFFAGHGVEVAGVDYIVAADAKIENDTDVKLGSLSLVDMLSAMDGVRKLRIAILDVGRVNPFVQSRKTLLQNGFTTGIVIPLQSSDRQVLRASIARIEPQSEPATLVAYAAKAGQNAQDGTGINSPFTAAIVKNIRTPDLDVVKLFRLVRADVLVETGGRQEPFIYGSLSGEDFFFVAK